MDTCKVKVCRICFAMDCKLHHLRKNLEVYKEYQLTIDTTLAKETNLPLYLCTTCSDRLLNFAQFREKALRAYSILLEIVDHVDYISVEFIQTVIKKTYRHFDIEESEEDSTGGDVNNEIKSELDDQSETNMSDDDGTDDVEADDDEAEDDDVAPCVVETAGVVKEEVDEEPVMDLVDEELGTGAEEEITFRDINDKIKTELDDEIKTECTRDDVRADDDEAVVAPYVTETADEIKEEVIDEESMTDVVDGELGTENSFDVIARQLRDEIETECMSDDVGADDDEAVVAPYVTETDDVIKEEVIDEKSVIDVINGELGTGEDVSLDAPAGQGDDKDDKDAREVVSEYFNQMEANVSENLLQIKSVKLHCDLCAYENYSETQFLTHLRAHAEDTSQFCNTRDYKTKSIETRTPHSTVNVTHACDKCGQSFGNKKRLTDHLCLQLGKDFSCDICKKSFRRKSTLRNHMSIHIGRRYTCGPCEKTYRSFSGFRVHMIKHFDGKLYRCKVCKRSFTRQKSLYLHMQKHSSDKPYSCDVCQKSYSRIGYLRRHQRIHSDDSSNDVKRHTQVHSDEKTYPCYVCSKTFRSKSDVSNHISDAHKKYLCKICNKSFLIKNFRRHRLIHTGLKVFPCEICKVSFRRQVTWNTHMLKHF